MLNNKPVLVAKHFQYKVEVFFEEIILDGPLGKIMIYELNFIKRGSLYGHSFIWIFNAPNIENEAAYTEFSEKTINAQLPNNNLIDPELFELFNN